MLKKIPSQTFQFRITLHKFHEDEVNIYEAAVPIGGQADLESML
jgi:hypothetical protein